MNARAESDRASGGETRVRRSISREIERPRTVFFPGQCPVLEKKCRRLPLLFSYASYQ